MINLKTQNQFIDTLKSVMSESSRIFDSYIHEVEDVQSTQVKLNGKGITPDEAKFIADFSFHQLKKYLHTKKLAYKTLQKKYNLTRLDAQHYCCTLSVHLIKK